MKLSHVLAVAFAAIVFACSPVKEDPTEKRINELLAQMTLEEKVNMIHGTSSFTSGGVERLGIPEIVMSDGPHGVRHEHGRDWEKDLNVYDSGTYLPTGTALAATWNPDLGYKFGTVLGSEARARGKDIILGPGLNIIRSPINGRNFEYLTEDPFLNGKMVAGYIKGVQEQDVAACAKHYIANSLEFRRTEVDVQMSERALREIYLPGFKAAVQDGGVYSIMAAYNKFRGDWCAQSEFLLTDVLKEELGFTGLAMSDWNAVNNTLKAVNAGLDIEMGTDLSMLWSGNLDYGKFYMADTVVSLVKAGTIQESVIDEKVKRILRVMIKIGMLDEGRKPGKYNAPEHQEIAREVASEAITLLKNEDNLLPLSQAEGLNVAVIGANANWKHSGAGGSSQVKAYYEVTPLQGLQNLLGETATITSVQGYTIARDGGTTDQMIKEAVRLVSEADVAIYYGGHVHGYSDEWGDNAYDAESVDKPDMFLPFGQDKLIQAILEANPNTVIVLTGGGPVDMTNWHDQAKAIVQAWYPGMEGGNALTDVLFGKVNPSGKLPVTFPVKLDDSPARVLAAMPTEDKLVIDHKDDIFVGYRYYDTYEVAPAYPFGHGLSYTTFDYSNLSVSKNGQNVDVTVTITNSGEMAGKEAVQVYVQDNESALPRPTKELKGFDKISLEPGQSQAVTISLGQDAFKYFDDAKMDWVLEPGSFTIHVGSSSGDIRLTGEVVL